MKRAVAILVAFVAVAFVTVAAQAESKGEQIFKQKCAMCHIVKGKGGSIGPDLTKIAARLKEGDLKVQLENPKKKNPSTSMPSFKTLPKADMVALLGYLKTLK
ncbi:cytochrome c [Oryzomonas sagensis]|uniref:Cytochrome c n=1 Tax=Oryzomonas sagensis TaxID=2603857 RepID=A0ABQ6TPD7_9BACT|nr:cytochrome c [Oryzomonas sagensis]KAB0670511.1 cytochrome c [Oryzomonas sagensis]